MGVHTVGSDGVHNIRPGEGEWHGVFVRDTHLHSRCMAELEPQVGDGSESLSAYQHYFLINALQPIVIHAPLGSGYCNDAVHD